MYEQTGNVDGDKKVIMNKYNMNNKDNESAMNSSCNSINLS